MSSNPTFGSEKLTPDTTSSSPSDKSNEDAKAKRPTLDRSAEIIATASGITLESEHERFMLKEDFKLLVRTYVSESQNIMPGFEATIKRRFDQINAYHHVNRYNAKAKETGKPTLQERAKVDAEGHTFDEVTDSAMVQTAKRLRGNPQMQEAFAGIMAKTAAKMFKESPELVDWLNDDDGTQS